MNTQEPLSTWTATIIENPEDPNELLLPIPEALIGKLGWDENTELEWTVDLESRIIAIKKI